jgi:hypothetical protein
MSEVTSVNGKTGAVVLAATDVEAVPTSAEGQPNGIATLNASGVLPEAQLPSSVEDSSAITAEPIVYVSKSGNDGNSGLGPAQAFATIKKAIEHLEALSGGTGVVEVGPGVFTENKLVRPSGCLIRGKGFALTKVTLKNGQNSNVIQDAKWGNGTEIGDGGGIEQLTINGNKANQTLVPAQALLTHQVTISSTPGTLYVNDASTFGSAELTKGNIWVGTTLCAYTELFNTGIPFNPAKPTETGWQFKNVTTVGGGSVTYYPEALILPGAQWGHGLAIQSSRTVVRDILIEQCIGSGRAYQGASGSYSYENKSFNVRSQQCNRYNVEVNPAASDGMSVADVGGNGALGDLLLMSANWEFHDYHPTGVSAPNYNARNAPYGVTICASKIRFYGIGLDTCPYGQVCVNAAWTQQLLYAIHIDGEMYQPSWASSGAGNGIAFYGQQDPGTLQALDIDIRMGMRGRLLHAIVYQPTTETVLVAGAEYKTPASGGEPNKLQVLNALSFSPLGSAIAGTVQLTSNAGAALDTISYTGPSSHTAWVAKEAAAKATTLEVDNASGMEPAGTVTIYPQSTSEAGVESLIVTYTKITGNTLEGIPAEGNGSIAEKLAVGAGVAQHYLTGVSSTGAGGVSIPDGSTAWQTGGATGRQVGTISGSAHIDAAYNRRLGALTYPSSGSSLRMRVSGRILNHPNPFLGSVTISAGSSSASVAHNLSSTPQAGCYGAQPTADPQQRWWVTASSTELTVHLAVAALGASATFNVWAQATPN